MATQMGGRCAVQFSKTPFPLVLAQRTSNQWFIEFPPRHSSFSGRHQPPTRYAWLYLGAALAGESLPSPLHFERQADGQWRLENLSSGETLEGFLSP